MNNFLNESQLIFIEMFSYFYMFVKNESFKAWPSYSSSNFGTK